MNCVRQTVPHSWDFPTTAAWLVLPRLSPLIASDVSGGSSITYLDGTDQRQDARRDHTAAEFAAIETSVSERVVNG